ncbi:D-2-hydroxyacid dehydrogenase [Alkalibacillus aidingensis]|uniref:D-2-hydroxyacid dehydrogenase n=1 Tax=Alkalibacillus aidingensis TaxID=2747607 RepID=UPI0016600CB2|nr:D-2-hydroxyacid dehydrogenase [Alkalibacillus aidingensis]
MNVVTTCKIKGRIKEELIEKYPQINFVWSDEVDDIDQHIPTANILITYGEGDEVTVERLEKATSLEWIMVISAGLDEMPLKTIHDKGIQVTNARGIHVTPMAEYAIAMLLQVSRQAKALMKSEQEHIWDRTVKMEEISGKKMLIAGTGAIGQEVARLAKAFNIETIGISRSGQLKDHFDRCYPNESLNEYISEADFVVGILPATTETEGFFGAKAFELMKEDAIFLNMGRGKTVDESALIEALQANQFHHAVLDVFEEEPLPKSSPLWDLENTTITPHLSGISRHYQPRAFDIFEENLKSFLDDKKLVKNVIDPKRGY